MDIWRKDNLANSRLCVSWTVKDSVAKLQLNNNADSPQLKSQYATSPVFSEKITDLLLLPEQRHKSDSQFRRAFTGTCVAKEQVPPILEPFVSNVEKWRAFFRQDAFLNQYGRHFTCINEDDYYVAPIGAGCLRLGRKANPEYGDYGEGFDFDPKAQPPILVEEAIYWEIPESKVVITLPHEVSNEVVATYYGYLSVWQAYMAEKLRRQKEMTAAMNRADEESPAKASEREQTLRTALFTP